MIMSRILKNRSGGCDLSEEVSQVVARRDIGNTHFVLLYCFPNKEVASIDVLHAAEMFRVVSDLNPRLVVHEQIDRLFTSDAVFLGHVSD